MVVLWLIDPLIPVTVAEYVPAAVAVGTVTVNVDEPGGVIDVGLTVVVSPPDAVEVSVTGFVKPLREFMVIVEVPEDPALIVIGSGDAEIAKSGVF
jgi:hypothetical protein